MQNRNRNIIFHVLGSLAFLSLPVIFSPDFSSSLSFIHVPFFQSDFLSYLLLLGFFYVCFYFLIPRYYEKRMYLRFFSIVLISYVVCAALPVYLVFTADGHGSCGPLPHHPGFPPPRGRVHGPPPFFLLQEIGQHFLQFVLVLIASIMFSVSRRLKRSEKEKLDAELSYLKAQINPHFLFNTLNSIYSLALSNSESAAPAIVKLSGMMRYVLSESHNDYVPLHREIEYIENYIGLQRLRFGNGIRLDFRIEGNTTSKKIAPLVLIPFVENAFKHGVNAEENSAIRITIEVTEQSLLLTVINNKVHVQHSSEQHSGLGIRNTQERLAMLYPERHNLSIQDTNELFSVSLIITIR